MLKSAMNFGALTGITLIAYTALINSLGLQLSWPAYLLLAGGIFIGTKKYRDGQLNGFISYGPALGHGTLIAVFSSILTGFFVYIFFKFIAPEKLPELMDIVETQMRERSPDMDEDQMQAALGMTRKFMQPGPMFIFSILTYSFFGFLLTLLIAAFVKKDETPFENSNPSTEA